MVTREDEKKMKEDRSEQQTSIIAQLCASAPSTSIRDCLRIYNVKKPIKQIKSGFNGCHRETLLATLDYLNVKTQDNFIKPAIIHNLLCRIQNLLPDICKVCGEEYCIDVDDSPLLPCTICGQDVHRSCIFKIMGESFASENLMEKINIFGIPGIHYICGPCEETTIPDQDAGKKKSNQKNSQTPNNTVM